ncbi:MAG: TROVE domain-containing protein [Sphingobacteriales bacterium]|nr:MAG: TROVE domain-containing protein [Sphingobacteriales bacterium]
MKFNFLKRKLQPLPPATNYEAAPAYRHAPEMELYAAVVTASLNDQFYESNDQRLLRIRALIIKNDPVFVAKLAVYAREEMYLRSIPLVLAVELTKLHQGDGLVGRLVGRVVQRADEITELLAYYALANNRREHKKLNRLSKQLQKGLNLSFNRFDEYQFAKYNRKTDVSLKDALFMVHPRAKDAAQQAIFDKIVRNELKSPYTWETALSALGQQRFSTAKEEEAAVCAKWEELIDNGRLGYMALLRNLRNILNAGTSKAHIEKVCAAITDEQAVLRSRQLPFRYLAAYRELKQVMNGYAGLVQDAIEEALKTSVHNMKGFDEQTKLVIACDVSGSMQQRVSAKSAIKYYDIGLLLGMLLQFKCDHVVSGMFGDRWKIISLERSSILSNVDHFYSREGEVGYATNGYLVLDHLIRARYRADKVMMFTDCQLWNSNSPQHQQNIMEAKWLEYKIVAPNAKLYLFDLAGHRTTPLRLLHNDVYLIAGWSDRVFDVLESLEGSGHSLQQIHEVIM